jgi:Flp pilus assembly protein TadD
MPTFRFSPALFLVCGTFVCGCAHRSAASRPTELTNRQLVNLTEAKPAEPSKLNKAFTGAKSKPAPVAAADARPTAAPEAPSNKIALARLSERHGQSRQARELYEAELKKTPDNPLIHHRLAIIAAKEERCDDAIVHFEKARELAPKDSMLLSDLGYAYYLQHRLDDAEECLREAVVADPNNKAAHNNLGLVLGVRGKFDGALSHFQKGGTDAAAYANLAYVHSQLGDLDQAVANYDRALSLDKEMRTAAEALVQLNELKGKLDPKIAARKSQTEKARSEEKVVAASRREATPVKRSAAARRAAEIEPVAYEPEIVEIADGEDVDEIDDSPIDSDDEPAIPAVARRRPIPSEEGPAPVFSASRRILAAQAEDVAAAESRKMVRPPARKGNRPANDQTADANQMVVRPWERPAEDVPPTRRVPTRSEMSQHQGSMSLKHPSALPTWSADQDPSPPEWQTSRAGDRERHEGAAETAARPGKMSAYRPGTSSRNHLREDDT